MCDFDRFSQILSHTLRHASCIASNIVINTIFCATMMNQQYENINKKSWTDRLQPIVLLELRVI